VNCTGGGCHAASNLANDGNNVTAGNSAAAIRAAIGSIRAMGFLSTLTDAQLADIATYIRSNP
jgi:hypothetical protein